MPDHHAAGSAVAPDADLPGIRLNLGRLNYLVIDANRHTRSLIKHIIRAIGYGQILEADNPAAGLSFLKSHIVDLVFVAAENADPGAIGFIRTVREGRDVLDPEIPIVVMSDSPSRETVQEARQAGAHEFIAKPFTADALITRIRAVTQHPRAFICTRGFTGPDRRRHDTGPRDGTERRR